LWDPNPPAQAVNTYTVTWAQTSGGTVQLVQTVQAGTNCTTTVCSVVFAAVPPANWNVSVYATNDTGNGPPNIISFSTISIPVPTAPTGLKIQKATTGTLAVPKK